MEKANKKIIYEYSLVNNAFHNELSQISDAIYSRNHEQNADWYRSFGDRFNSILGFNGQTMEQFVNFVTTINITPEQKRALFELRKEPMFKKLMGEIALQQKVELENVLESKITFEGMTFADEYVPKVAIKTVQQLEQELNTYSDKLSELLSPGIITEQQYDIYNQNLDYIYDYYISCSKGEQIPFRRMSNEQYEQIEKRAIENGISLSEQLIQETRELKYDHDVIQELQSQGIKR